jgi:hypothetical protein
MPYTYPPAAPSISGDTLTISRFLSNPTQLARRLRTLLEQRYISDSLLTGRFQVSGGAIQYETGETIFSADDPKAVAPGSEYPTTSAATGTASIAKTVKWGQDAIVTDEAIKRQAMDPVNRALQKLVNQNVKYVDTVTLAAIASAVTATAGASAAWSTAGTTASSILQDVMIAKANIVALNQGYSPDTVVVDDLNWAYAMAKFAAAGYLPRETNGLNPLVTGDFPTIAGMRWLATPNIPTAAVGLVLDSTQLGGMADEDLGGPGYVSASGPNTAPVQVKTMRDDEEDQWRIRARRVVVPVILEPAAARKITGLS